MNVIAHRFGVAIAATLAACSAPPSAACTACGCARPASERAVSFGQWGPGFLDTDGDGLPDARRLDVAEEPANSATTGNRFAGLPAAAPLLGVGFCQVVDIEADVVLDERFGSGKGERGPCLRVRVVAGQPVTVDIRVEWTFGNPAHAEVAREQGPLEPKLTPGSKYRLRGFEAGEYRGLVRGYEWDEWGPPQSRNAGFHHVFRILSVERIGPSSP